MKRGPLLKFLVGNIEKSKIYLNTSKYCVSNVCVPCYAFPKIGTLNLKMSPDIY